MAEVKKLPYNSIYAKILSIVIIGGLIYLILDAIFFKGARSFYCLPNDEECITVWKRLDDSVYIIPGKYKDNAMPTTSYIKTINGQMLTLYFTEQLPNKIIVRNEGNYKDGIGSYSLKNKKDDGWQFVEYSKEYEKLLYSPNAKKFKDVKPNTNYIGLEIKRNSAVDKFGNKLRETKQN